MLVVLRNYVGLYNTHPEARWDYAWADDSDLNFCGAIMLGGLRGQIPEVEGHERPKIFDDLMEEMYYRLKEDMREEVRGIRGIRIIMADTYCTRRTVENACRFGLKVEDFARWLAKKHPGQMTATRACINPNSGNTTKVWVFRIP